jgi:hypothetical protein
MVSATDPAQREGDLKLVEHLIGNQGLGLDLILSARKSSQAQKRQMHQTRHLWRPPRTIFDAIRARVAIEQ